MPSSKSSGGFKPFKKLGRLLPPLPDTFPNSRKRGANKPPETCFPDDQLLDEATLFKQAMEGVQPISKGHRNYAGHSHKQSSDSDCTDDDESLLKLKRLISNGEGFVVADTPEYVAGADSKVGHLIIKRLHRGDFAIQAYIDLHGLSVPAAQDAVTAFFKESIQTGKRGVLIVHGRGLSSPGEPVLKSQVIGWLTRGPWRKWVMAYASARSCDGGTGATYVLLRGRPLKRRYRKNVLK